LELEFQWLARLDSAQTRSSFDLSTVPSSNEGLQGTGRNGQNNLIFKETNTYIKIGDIVRITTTDPHELPLPNRQLLEMQWILTRVAAMSGYAEDEYLWGMKDDGDDEDIPLLSLAKHALEGEPPETSKTVHPEGRVHVHGSSSSVCGKANHYNESYLASLRHQ
jgi:hypothetical protein